tara:strand:+ start:2497 stop:2646 length:150 start_codon:yes stop_codon:yes gene_type:complete
MVVTRTELAEIVSQINTKFEELEQTIKEVKTCNCATDKQKATKASKKAA